MKIRVMWRIVALVLGLVVCDVAVANMPDFYAEPGLNPSRSYSQSIDFDAIDPFTGKLQLHHTDILIPGNGGLNLEVGRSYTSGDAWTMGFGYVYRKATDTLCATGLYGFNNTYNPVLVLADGSRHILSDADATSPSYATSSYLFITNNLWKASCATNGNGLIVTSPEGTKYDMTFQSGDATYQKWYVTKITDRNSNSISITYDSTYTNGALITGISTSDGRSLTYSYNTIGSYKTLSTITEGSRTWRYTYIDNTAAGFSGLSVGTFLLKTVTLPDNTAWMYDYYGDQGINAGSYKVKSVTTPRGGVVTYTYGFVKFNSSAGYTQDEVILSRSISVGGTWSYSYVPSTGTGVLDTTTVTAPNSLQTIVYKHFGYNTIAVVDEVWKIGLLAEKTVGSIQTENYSWGIPLSVSAQNDLRSFPWATKYDNNLNKALLATKTITRDGATYATTYSNFDVYGNPQTITEAGPNGGNKTTNLTYNADSTRWVLHQVKNETVVGGSSTMRLFDSNHNLTSSAVNGVLTEYTYTVPLDGTIASTSFPRGLVHYYSNYKRGIPQTEMQPEGISIARVVSSAGMVTSETNARGYTTSYTYDGLNRPTNITYPVGHNPLNISYAPTQTTSTRDTLVENITYDGFGRPTNVNLGGIVTTYTYDPLGRVTFKSNPSSASGISYTYDGLNRVKTATYADGNFKSYTYGVASMAIKDERNLTTTYTYRAYGDPNQTYLMSITAADPAASVSMVRNTMNQITSVTQAGLTRSYTYNANAYLASVTDPEIGLTSYGRDAAGNMTTRTVGASGLTTYTYDLQNRLSTISFPAGTPSISQTYTKTHKLLTATAGATTRTLGYDSIDNITSESLAVDSYNFSASYAYNANDQLSSITYPQSNKTVSFALDVLGRPQSVSGYASGVTYWPSGQVNQITYQNGTVSTYGQNTRLWPSTFNTKKTSTATIYTDHTYAYDPVGNLASVVDTSTPDFNRAFGYDAINRLTTINASSSWGTGSIAYDGRGNITSQSFGTSGITYTYTAQNRLVSVSGALRNTSYTYDSYGDILADGAGKTYTYNDTPILTSVSDSNAGTAISYFYDGVNRRTKVIKNGITTYEFHDSAGRLLLEYTLGIPNKLVEYIYLGNTRIAQRLSYQ